MWVYCPAPGAASLVSLPRIPTLWSSYLLWTLAQVATPEHHWCHLRLVQLVWLVSSYKLHWIKVTLEATKIAPSPCYRDCLLLNTNACDTNCKDTNVQQCSDLAPCINTDTFGIVSCHSNCYSYSQRHWSFFGTTLHLTQLKLWTSGIVHQATPGQKHQGYQCSHSSLRRWSFCILSWPNYTNISWRIMFHWTHFVKSKSKLRGFQLGSSPLKGFNSSNTTQSPLPYIVNMRYWPLSNFMIYSSYYNKIQKNAIVIFVFER